MIQTVSKSIVETFRNQIIPGTHMVLMSFDFVIGPTERAVLASYTMVVPACLHDQCIRANSQSELVIPNWF